MRRLLICALAICTVALSTVNGQQAQNPSPMVEHTRAHRRLVEQSPPGRREKLDLGTLFLPAGLGLDKSLALDKHLALDKRGGPDKLPRLTKRPAILFFFHGGTWLPEVAAALNHVAVVSVQAGSGSAAYAQLFDDPQRFLGLLRDAESKAGARFGRVMLGSWSAGCGAIRQILNTPESYRRVDGVLLIDGIHTGYVDGKPGPLESSIDADNLQIWLKLGRDAMALRKRAIVTHSEIFPGTFASTTETADYVVAQLGLARRAVLNWGPMGLQQLSEVRAGRFLLIGYAGNSAPDHVDQLHSLPVFLKWLK
ncbi:MAG TPA: hypothetical protein VNY05_14050 [Candidatus Acidoferrales bacterium]|nr:hypothetical protein [Candidatus Acidoferrales bacterium]